jgi:hypothetical protein
MRDDIGGRRLAADRARDRLFRGLIVEVLNLLIVLGIPMDEYADTNEQIVGFGHRDNARRECAAGLRRGREMVPQSCRSGRCQSAAQSRLRVQHWAGRAAELCRGSEVVPLGRGSGLRVSLITKKIEASILTLEKVIRKSDPWEKAMQQAYSALTRLDESPPTNVIELRALEANAAAAYFRAWRGIPIK